MLLMALGGFVGNFIFSLTDHAQNGFFHWTEWIPVVSSAFAVGFLLYALPDAGHPAVPLAVRRGPRRAGGGRAARLLPARSGEPCGTVAEHVVDNFVYGAPALAPLLFPNLVLLACIGLWVLSKHLSADTSA